MSTQTTLSLKKRVLQSGSWTMAGYGLNQALRLAGNLILTRLLFPEAFGMMAIIQAVMYGVHMLTDVGIAPSVVQKDRGNDPTFLNTAWTVQIVRGLLAWLGLCLLALPIAKLYEEPLLSSILLVIGVTAFIEGFNSTKLLTAQRNLDAGRVTIIDVVTYTLGLIITILLAWITKSVWALVWGSMLTSLLKMVASHLFLHGPNNHFAWDRNSIQHLRGFGRWILLGSGITFLSNEGIRMMIGAMLDMRELALFTLANTMSLMLWQAMQLIAGRVYFPAFSETFRINPHKFMNVVFKARLTIILPSWILAVIFIFFGSPLMHALYDVRYHESGKILELLAAGSLVSCIWGSYARILLSKGKVASETMLTIIQIILQVSAIYIGYYNWGGSGIVIGIAASNWVMYPISAYVMHQNGLWQPKLDLIFYSLSLFVLLLAWPHLSAIK